MPADHNWCFTLTSSIASWFSTISDPERPGEILFCHKGNLLVPSGSAGLGASCLALKLAYQTGIWDRLASDLRGAWISHVRAFQRQRSGYFEDPTLLKIADRKAGWLWPKKDIAVRRAETRQAAAALLSVGSQPLYAVAEIPDTEKAVLRYVDGLPWDTRPWHSGSHASHLVFFLKLNAELFHQQSRFQRFLSVVMSYLDGIQDPGTGSWFKGNVSTREKVNAAMKVLTIYRLLGQSFRWPERLIDMGLHALDEGHACNSLDVLFVLHESALWTSYRNEEVRAFAGKMLDGLRRHVRPDGGLSFFPDRANTTYYGITVSQGLAESDVHGTHLLTWAIALCANLLGFKDDLGWRFPVT